MKEIEEDKPNFYIEPSRIQDWTDGIFAFSMTLLIVSVTIPEITGYVSEEILKNKLLDMVPTFLTFIMSFVLIAIFWMVHHKQFQSITKSNDTLIWINVVMMLLVVFMPFSTNLIDDYSSFKISNFIFNLNMFLIGLSFYIQYAYSADAGLLDERISKDHIRIMKWQNSLIGAVSFLALTIGLFYPDESSYVYLIIPIILFFLKTKNRNSRKIS